MAEADPDSTTGKSPAFQFYPKDFLSDSNVVGMSLQERGAYITLLCLCWLDGSLPADTTVLARRCGVPFSAFRKLWPALSVCFREIDGRLIQPRLERERAKQAEFRRLQAERGRLGGRRDKAGAKPVLANPPLESGEANASENETRIEAESSSPIFISDLQSSDSGQKREPRALARTRGLMAGALAIHHGDCLAHGPVCFRPRNATKFLQRFGGDHERMVAWAKAICAEWVDRTERGENVPEGDDFDFWAARYDEHFKRKSDPHVSKLTSALARASADFLGERS